MVRLPMVVCRRVDVEPVEKRVTLILADITGYTRFMVSNQMTLLHSQAIITELLKAIIKQVEIPLEVSKLEGDAVFLYAVQGEGSTSWGDVCAAIGAKLLRFFEAFAAKVVELDQSNMCDCSACSNVRRLGLKVIVHCGQALFYSIGRFEELSGVDVILAHRLLKNSVQSDQYILMTQAAYQAIEFPGEIGVTEAEEWYEEIGSVKTYVYRPPAAEQFFLEIKPVQNYNSARARFKNKLLKMLYVLPVQWGLLKPREFKHLPKL